ncbi:MAG: glycosyltransferase 87 family protein [Anaerolineae bacterium]
MKGRYEIGVLAVFLLSLIVYMVIAWTVLEPLGYYGTKEQPRFADPWIARAETILQGGVLYRDVFTTTPPLMNYLLIPPVVVSGWFDHQNPWATSAFMVYFSLFNLFIAYALLYTAEEKAKGYHWALFYLLNPLTFGNTVLRRQDESVLVFFFALAMLMLIRRRHVASALVMGLSLLVKLTGGMMIPVSFLNGRRWRYLVIPFVVFAVIFLPFYLKAGEAAIFWNPQQEHAEHPFQFGGVSLGALWLRWQGGAAETILRVSSVLFIAGVTVTLLVIAWRPRGDFYDLAFLVAGVLLLSPKLHCGYFSILVFALTPLMRHSRLVGAYFGLAVLALVADMYKWPVENFQIAWWFMFGVEVLLGLIIFWIRRDGATAGEAFETDHPVSEGGLQA